MCGIAGIVNSSSYPTAKHSIKNMTDAIAHRGPDGEGAWQSNDQMVTLGHRRLSIIDLSDAGSQPMHYLDRYVLVFNGEIYNYIEIKEDLQKKGYKFLTNTDTEVLLALYHEKKEECLVHLDGMFAFALYDKNEKELFCARDRFGEKPFFYYNEIGKKFLFASEMKALWAAGINKQPDNEAVYNYLVYGYLTNQVNKEKTFYSNIKKLPPSHYLVINDSLHVTIKQYYDFNYKPENSAPGIKEATNGFKELITRSVERRLRSDVPVGSSLSGGLDSSIIVSIINELSKEKKIPQNTFSAKFPGFEKDESKYIDLLLKQINASPYDTFPGEEGFLEDLELLFHHQEEPFGSTSIYAQWEVMKLAKENNVTVLLDGQGADEMLAGYPFYFRSYFQELYKMNGGRFREQWKKYKELNTNTISKDLLFYGGIYFPTIKNKMGWMKDKMSNKYISVLNHDFYKSYKRLSIARQVKSKPGLNYTLYESLTNIETLLRYADRNSMAHSREVRLPYLSHEIVEFLFKLPAEYKIHNGWTKYIARIAYQNELPGEIVWRKEKVGYEPPQKKWMNNPIIREKIIASKEKLVKEKFLNNKVLGDPVQAVSTSDRGDNSWAYLMCGMLLDK